MGVYFTGVRLTATLEVWHMVNDIPELRQLPIVSPYYHF
jgi:hypothetical protein